MDDEPPNLVPIPNVLRFLASHGQSFWAFSYALVNLPRLRENKSLKVTKHENEPHD